MDSSFGVPPGAHPVKGDIVRIGSATWRARRCECGDKDCDGWRLTLVEAPEGPALALAAVDALSERRVA